MATMALAVVAVLVVCFLARQHKLLVLLQRQLAAVVVVLWLVAAMGAMVAILPSLD
jgi:hypothetical protein